MFCPGLREWWLTALFHTLCMFYILRMHTVVFIITMLDRLLLVMIYKQKETDENVVKDGNSLNVTL